MTRGISDLTEGLFGKILVTTDPVCDSIDMGRYRVLSLFVAFEVGC